MRKKMQIKSSERGNRYYQISLMPENEREIKAFKEAPDNKDYLAERGGEKLRNAEIGERIEIDFEFAAILNKNSDIEIGDWLQKWGEELQGMAIE